MLCLGPVMHFRVWKDRVSMLMQALSQGCSNVRNFLELQVVYIHADGKSADSWNWRAEDLINSDKDVTYLCFSWDEQNSTENIAII